MSKNNTVGYGKPPKHTRFKKGKSGNPRGRPKGSKNFLTELVDELLEPVTIREGGRAKKVSKQRAMIKRNVLRAMEGDPRMFAAIAAMLSRLVETDSTVEESDLSANDKLILERFIARRTSTNGKQGGGHVGS